jgi:hypothetical protein
MIKKLVSGLLLLVVFSLMIYPVVNGCKTPTTNQTTTLVADSVVEQLSVPKDTVIVLDTTKK